MRKDVLPLLIKLNLISNRAQKGDKHYSHDWINIECPFCSGSKGYHLGYWITKGIWNCFRCGPHQTRDVLKRLTGLDDRSISSLIKDCPPLIEGKTRIVFNANEDSKTSNATSPSFLSLPIGCKSIMSDDPQFERHRNYLASRNFDPKELEKTWKLYGTGPIGPYKFRIIAPIFYGGRMVSYQGRDITGKSKIKYKACSKSMELVNHKRILYGLDFVNDVAIIVEGIADVWRLGKGAVATFGIEFTQPQVAILSKLRKCFIMFDAEEIAQKKAKELAESIVSLNPNVKVEIIKLSGVKDPAELTEKEAREISSCLLE